ncbi:CehA/McbA family metallohydrolase [Paenibacillus alba]|uniref:CehA/McbA family metallohydrolase n=1 Tax=Paenibacillus alba TaxID=1197127 RepID=A0ABU6GC59_9BACL|nr:CehA/McbA family metallohydrolase [Paenibacillus alba]MEC0231785.1 CehA/McbA family metallohydrolase [Paenibacillus alba]
MSKKWLPYELHTHTYHSDGEHSLSELAQSAKEIGLYGIAMTDHNTMSPLLEREAVQQENQLHIVRGMEWTTFFGHMLMIGITRYVDWRDLGIKDIHKGIERVHQQGGVVGIAHPFRIGSPLCTGCYWEYEVSNWHDIDYIEVWSYTLPSILTSNQRAYRMWTDLLNQGYRITGVCGRDWHISSKKTQEPVAVSYLQLESSDAESSYEDKSVVEAIRKGAVSVTMGPLLLISIASVSLESVYGMGDEVPSTHGQHGWEAKVTLDMTERAAYWQLDEQEFTIILIGNLGVMSEQIVAAPQLSVSIPVQTAGLSWLRAELYGVIANCRTMIAFTNPIYFQVE